MSSEPIQNVMRAKKISFPRLVAVAGHARSELSRQRFTETLGE
jgi:hypothetical protein